MSEPQQTETPGVDPPMQPSPTPSQWSMGTAELSTGAQVGAVQVASCTGTQAYFLDVAELRAISGQMATIADMLEQPEEGSSDGG